jgi:hypothetical protein
MKSNKQRRGELRLKKWKRAIKRGAYERPEPSSNAVRCNAALLAPTTSYSIADFYSRGYYLDKPFTCIDCGKSEVWAATQQKWWYEIAKGDIQTTAVRCRNCRRKERERKNEARRIHLEGLERKKAKQAARTDSTG